LDTKVMEIAQRKIGAGNACYVIAEAGVNHNGSLEMAKRLVLAARQAGADSVKFQTFKTEKVISRLAPKAAYQEETTGAGESQFDMVRKLELPFEGFRELQAYCKELGIEFLSTPFDFESADFLESLGVAAFKVPSGEITNLPFLEHIARKGKPLIVSTGMSDLEEVRAAMKVLTEVGKGGIVLLHCVSNYPAAPASVNLRAMTTLARAFGVPVGYSDHTQGIEIPLAAVALGACVIEKHFTLDRNLPGPDHRASLEPNELADMVRGIRNVEAALGDGVKRPVAEELNTAAVARRSLVAARDIDAGTRVTPELIAILRPGTGLPPSMRDRIIGKTAIRNIAEGTPFDLDMLR
jgi:N,N'-diacetyllegionaminate synthase